MNDAGNPAKARRGARAHVPEFAEREHYEFTPLFSITDVTISVFKRLRSWLRRRPSNGHGLSRANHLAVTQVNNSVGKAHAEV